MSYRRSTVYLKSAKLPVTILAPADPGRSSDAGPSVLRPVLEVAAQFDADHRPASSGGGWFDIFVPVTCAFSLKSHV